MGFDYEIYAAPDGVYGRMDENENWNGMIRELVDKVREGKFNTNCATNQHHQTCRQPQP